MVMCKSVMLAVAVEEKVQVLPHFDQLLYGGSGFSFSDDDYRRTELKIMRFFQFKVMLPTIPHFT